MSTSSSSSSVMREKPKICKEFKTWTTMVRLPSMAVYGLQVFMWKEDVDAVFAKEGNWKVLELKNKALEMKIENLDVEKMILVEENKKLRMI
ncbi:hypothetical protein QVD17_24077 [Tagetes erecta]|uniref:Uncharacterized protein n=1 Tax=Tagetes erecta TaxID=13708 RepID=A0AAD8NMK7_TARER|nr:hypothetical protein QVD17_24077 [Tagetes erecta]